jgi:hypothetical protein
VDATGAYRFAVRPRLNTESRKAADVLENDSTTLENPAPVPVVTALENDWTTAVFVCRLLVDVTTSIPGNRGPVIWETTTFAKLEERTTSDTRLAVAWGNAVRTGVVVLPMVMVWLR